MTEILDFMIGSSYDLYLSAFELRFCSILLFVSYHLELEMRLAGWERQYLPERKKFILTESVFSSLLISFMPLFTISYLIADQLEKQ